MWWWHALLVSLRYLEQTSHVLVRVESASNDLAFPGHIAAFALDDIPARGGPSAPTAGATWTHDGWAHTILGPADAGAWAGAIA